MTASKTPPGLPEPTIRVAVVDDQPMVRDGFAALLDAQPDMTVVGRGADGREAVALVPRAQPDVILMDIRMPQLNGLDATRTILDLPGERKPHILILTTYDADEYVFAALRAGTSGFLLKDATADDLAAAVRIVAGGDGLLSPSVTRRLIADYAGRTRRRLDRRMLAPLTERELDVMRAVARGGSNAEIAAELYVGEETVKSHVSRILAKLGLRDRTQIVIAAYESGLIAAGEGE